MARKHKHRKKQGFWHHVNQLILRYEYKHTTAAVLVLVLFIAFFDSAIVVAALGLLENMGYAGGFIAGVLSASFITTAPAIVVLLALANDLDPFALAVVAGAGSMVGDWLILLFIRDRLSHELEPLFRKLHLHEIVERLRYRYTMWILWLVGIVSLATPLPDEVGISILGISHFKSVYLLAISFLLNTIGVFALVMAARAFLP